MVMVAAVMASAVMAIPRCCGGRLTGAGWVVVGRGLGQRLLPGAFQHLQLKALLAAIVPKGHPCFPGNCVHLGRLHNYAPLCNSGTWWFVCGKAALNRQSTFGGAQRCLSLEGVDLRLTLWMSTGIGLARQIWISYGQTAALWWQIVEMQLADDWGITILAGEGVRQQMIWRKIGQKRRRVC